MKNFLRLSHLYHIGNNIELTGSLRLGGAEHFYMEPHSVIAIPQEKDELIVHFR